MLPDPELRKDTTVIKVYANEILIITKGFRSREQRSLWMELITEAMKGVNFYFELSYYYQQSTKPKYEYVKLWREKKKAQPPEKTRHEIFVTPKSFERPPAVYSNAKFF